MLQRRLFRSHDQQTAIVIKFRIKKSRKTLDYRKLSVRKKSNDRTEFL